MSKFDLLNGQTHRKVRAQSFRSKGRGSYDSGIALRDGSGLIHA